MSQAPTETVDEWKEKYEALLKVIEAVIGPEILSIWLRMAERHRTGEKRGQ